MSDIMQYIKGATFSAEEIEDTVRALISRHNGQEEISAGTKELFYKSSLNKFMNDVRIFLFCIDATANCKEVKNDQFYFLFNMLCGGLEQRLYKCQD